MFGIESEFLFNIALMGFMFSLLETYIMGREGTR